MIWIAEYSAAQDAFHVQPLSDALSANLRRALVKDKNNDWCLIGWGNEAKVRRIVKAIREGQVQLLRRKA